MRSRFAALVRLLSAIAILAAAHDVPGAAQQPTFSSRVDTVRVDVSVRQDGRTLRGLTASDFEVLDSGVPQRIDFVGLDEVPVSVVLALDMSGSVQGLRLLQLRAAGERLIGMLAPGETAALVAFTDLVTIASRFTSNRNILLSALQQTGGGGDTALRDATHAALVLGQSESGRPLVIVFSDGTDTLSFLSAEQVLQAARRVGPVVYAVTSTREDRDGFLADLVRLTGGRRLEVSSLERVSDAFTEILSESRDRYLLSYTPTGVPSGGWHDVVVRVRGRRADVRARPGYLAGP